MRWFASDALGAVAVTGAAPVDALDAANRRPGVAVEMLTSGTTGPPKRVPLTYETFSRVLDGAKHYERNPNDDVRLRSGVTIVNSPMVHLGGLFRLLQCVNDGRSFCLLERFRVDEWIDAVRRHRPRTVSLVPAALRMVLDADLDRADFASVRSVISGTAPLAPDDADAFFEKYGVPVLISYAATEFGGGVAGWNLADHERYWATKRGSVGRAHPGCELRVVDPDTGAPLGADEEGLLEVKARQMGDDTGWTRTTDLARIDADGFVWILGRADQAIIRGGFKIRPDDVRAALERDPRVRGAAVVEPARRAPRRGSGRRGRAAPGRARGLRRRAARRGGEGARALRAARRAAARRRRCRAHPRARSTSPPCARCSAMDVLMEPWTFGVEPLPQALVGRAVAAAGRRTDPGARTRRSRRRSSSSPTSRAAEAALAASRAPDDPVPRLGADAPADGRPVRRPRARHRRVQPVLPRVRHRRRREPRASGTVTFPLVFEGPPGVVHGGVLATFFDCVVQHHNCDVGVAGKTTSLLVEYRRPTPLGVPLRFEIDRDDRRTPHHVARPSVARRRHAVHRDDGGGGRRPQPAPPRPAAADGAVSATVVDAGDDLPLTVPALLARTGGRRAATIRC